MNGIEVDTLDELIINKICYVYKKFRKQFKLLGELAILQSYVLF